MEPLRPSRIGDAGKGLIPMALITPPRELPVQGDRSLECELALDLPLRQLVDDAISAGWEPNEYSARSPGSRRRRARASLTSVFDFEKQRLKLSSAEARFEPTFCFVYQNLIGRFGSSIERDKRQEFMPRLVPISSYD